MIHILQKILDQDLYSLLQKPEIWQTIVINRHDYPVTLRAFTIVDDIRIALHKFEPRTDKEDDPHPHPWPAAFKILSGGYDTKIGVSKDRFSEPENWMQFHFPAGTIYTMDHPCIWHSVVPRKTTYTVMINGRRYAPDVEHTMMQERAAKILREMTEVELREHLNIFKGFLAIESNDWDIY